MVIYVKIFYWFALCTELDRGRVGRAREERERRRRRGGGIIFFCVQDEKLYDSYDQ